MRAGRTVTGMDQAAEPVDPARPVNKTGAMWVLLIAAAALCCGGLALRSALGGPDAGGAGGAIAFCEQVVKDKLLSPGSARFSDEHTDQIGDEYTVSGSVDSQNAFGALLRRDFTCRAQPSGADWTLLSLTGLD